MLLAEFNLYNLTDHLKDTSETYLPRLADLDYITEFGRNTHWLGEEGLNYPYAGKPHIARNWGIYLPLTNWLNKIFHTEFNHLLINQYLPDQSLTWHKDDEPELTGPIASLSLGDSAFFYYSKFLDCVPDKLELKEYTLLVGDRDFWNTYYHRVSKPLNKGIRYNLTWRTIK